MIDRVEKVFRSLERMRRFHGHFFNWYDLNELRVLEPAYVSTVDSGNFAGHLIALKQACYEMMKDPDCSELDAKRLRAIAERAHAYAVEMDFRFLYDVKRKLFTIGYHTGSNTVDHILLRPARLGVPTRVVHSGGEGRCVGRSLVQAGSFADRCGGHEDAALVERQHVRIPDAGAGDADIPVYSAGSDSQGKRQASDRLWRGAWRAVGRFGVSLRGARRLHTTIIAVLAFRIRAHRAQQDWCRSLRDGAGDGWWSPSRRSRSTTLEGWTLGPTGSAMAELLRVQLRDPKTIVCTFMAHHIG